MDFIVVIDIDGSVVIGMVGVVGVVVVVVVWLAFYSFSSHNKFNRIAKVAWARSFDRIGWVNAVQDTLNKRDKIDKMGIGADVYGIQTWAWRGGERCTIIECMCIHFQLHGIGIEQYLFTVLSESAQRVYELQNMQSHPQ